MSIGPNEAPRIAHVSVPATSANLGPGFDCLGLALELRNDVTFESGSVTFPVADGSVTEYHFEATGLDTDKIPDGSGNLLVEAAEHLFRHVGRRPAQVTVRLINRIPVGSGLGSSSSAIVAGLVGANLIVDGGLSNDALLRMAVDIEGHPDNVAPAMLGGLVLGVLPDAQDGPEQLILRRFEPPRLSAVVVMPDFELLTSAARAVLPGRITRGDSIFNTSRVALFLHAMVVEDYSCLRVAMADRLHQPYRLGLIPGATEALAAAYDAGALGVALSGAGPSLLAFAETGQDRIAEAMSTAFAGAGLACRRWFLDVAAEGARQAVFERSLDAQLTATNSPQ